MERGFRSKLNSYDDAMNDYIKLDELSEDGTFTVPTKEDINMLKIEEEVVNAVPYGTPPIISADKAEEFLNMKPSEEALKRRERLAKHDYMITDNTVNVNCKECDQVNKLKTKLKEVRKENRQLKKEITEMLKYAWYKEGENNVD